ncbi:MAG: alpha/beta hydrolase [Treponemataceae bacterium]|nr:alpha/beta hydrolase [Treponemataceae bacterium]
MNTFKAKKPHRLLKLLGIILCIITFIVAGLFLVLMTNTQVIVGVIQTFAQQIVNTKNLYEPLHNPVQAVKDNHQYVITELKYSDMYPNSFLDITYPDENVEIHRPTFIYFHGGGFFGGSKCDGDPLAEGDATALLDDICAEGFNLVNVDYALVPEYHFPTPVIQANEAFRFLMDHAEEYHLDMEHVIIMGSSAGAIITSQIGSVITNPEYAALLGIEPVLLKQQVTALVIDDAPLDYENFSLGTKVLVGNYVKGSIFLSKKEIHKYNNIQSITENYIPCVLLGSEYHADMRALHNALEKNRAEHILIDPLAEHGELKQHCFVASERSDEIAKDAYDRMINFLLQKIQVTAN